MKEIYNPDSCAHFWGKLNLLRRKNMSNKLSGLILVISLLFAFGCASTLEKVNKGAKEAGKTGGKIIRVPSSVSEGAAEGVAGEPESDPYDREESKK